MANPAYRPPALPYREKPPPALPPCPWCGGVVILTLIGRKLETYCTECPWNPEADDAPDVSQ